MAKQSKLTIATWSCYLKYSGIGGFMNGSGVIVEFDTPPIELQSRLPGLHKLSSPPETRYALLTCNHIIPDWQATQDGWWLYVGSGRRAAHKLDGLVCGVVSCCGENGVISFGPKRSDLPVLLPHHNDFCRLKLDFTMLLLNENFERQVMKGGMPRPPLVHIPSFPELSDPQTIFSKIEPDGASAAEQRMQLCHREESDTVILPVEIDRCLSTSTVSGSSQQLKDEIEKYHILQRIHYKESVVSGKIADDYSGSPLVYCYPASEEVQLVGIHVGITADEEENDTHTPENECYVGISIYGIFQLLSGNPAAFFAIMEPLEARRMWSFRWAHLLTHQLDKCKSSLSLEYRVEILQQIFEKSLIQLDFKDPPENILADLQVLTAIFTCFDEGDVAAAIEKVYAGNKKKIKEFEENVTELTKRLPDLLLNVGTDDEEMAKAWSECYNVMLNFKYEGIIQGVLYTGDSLASLCKLHKTFKHPEILGNFIDILQKHHQIMQNKHAEDTEAQRQQQKEEYEAQLQQQTEEYKAQLQRQKEGYQYEVQLKQQKEKHDFQMQQLKEWHRAELEEQRDKFQAVLREQNEEMEGRLQKRSAAERELKTKNARLILELQSLQVDKQRLQQYTEELEGKTLTTDRAEIEKWRSRVADHERREKQLSEELEQAKAKLKALHM